MDANEARKYEFYLGKLNEIPSLPTVVTKLIGLIDEPMTSIKQLEDLLVQDQSLTLKVLKLANSAYYAIPGGATTVNRAITYLGYDCLKQLVLAASLFDAFDVHSTPEFDIDDFWMHSFGVATTSETIAKMTGLPSPADAFTCGLVHDVGKLVLAIIDFDAFIATCSEAQKKKTTLFAAERALGAPEHTYWGMRLAEKWKLPLLIQSAIKDHHTRKHGLRMSMAAEINQVVDAVYVANQITHDLNIGHSGHDGKSMIESDILEHMGLDPNRRSELFEKIEENLEHARNLMEAISGTQKAA